MCRILNISKRTLQHYRDTSVLPFIQIGHKCYYKCEDVVVLLEKSNRKIKPKNIMIMEHEIVNNEMSEIKELISDIKGVSKRLQEVAQTHCPLFGREIYLTGREVCERLFVSPRTLQAIATRALFPTLKSQGKYSIDYPTSIDYYKRIIGDNTYS